LPRSLSLISLIELLFYHLNTAPFAPFPAQPLLTFASPAFDGRAASLDLTPPPQGRAFFRAKISSLLPAPLFIATFDFHFLISLFSLLYHYHRKRRVALLFRPLMSRRLDITSPL
jgi:hypothetical protein